MAQFTNLHAHTEASISDGLFGVKKWIEALKMKGFKAHAVTDHGVMTNLIPFYHAAKAEKITPILGVEFYYVDDPLDKTESNRKANHLILIAKNYHGFQNLLKLSKLSFTDGFYYKNRIGLEWVKKYNEGLVCLTACMGGVLANEIWREKDGTPHFGLENRYRQFKEIFGDDFYVEFQGHVGEQKLINEGLFKLSSIPDFKHIVSNDCHYILPEHAKIQGLLKEMAYGKMEAGQSYTSCDSLWLKTAPQVYEGFRKNHEYMPKEFVAEGMRRTWEIAEKCMGFEFPKVKHYLPTYGGEVSSDKLFKKICIENLDRFLKTSALYADKKTYLDRFAKEYGVISKYGLQDYFLIVWDIVRFANEKGIYVGLGRGSAAGCLISYLLGIVGVDPLRYGLLFERFLNENRCESGELPDIDLDFESNRRGEIKEYILLKYGRDRVCEIGTYGRMKLKSALIDFGKAMKVVTSKEILDITTKLDLDKSDAQSLYAACEAEPRLMEIMSRSHDYAFVVEEINGQIKSQSVHPAGVLISNQPIEEITPIKTQKKQGEKERVITTQSEDKYVIAQGLMKLDILGLKEYDIVKFIVENASTGMTCMDYRTKIMDDTDNADVWAMFQAGRTEGVFQFASSGMQQLLKDMHPTEVRDLIAANALYRPGSLENGWHTQYCRRKNGKEEVDYPHPSLASILEETYGLMVYQEQTMDVIHSLGGVSLVESDIIRSALGKKNKEKLDSFRKKFIDGAESKVGRDKAAKIWEQIEKASGYSFNKSHSAAYSILAYISQYLKVKYPKHFWAAHLEWDCLKNKREEVLAHKRAAIDMGVTFQLPSVNRSRQNFYVEVGGDVVWSFVSIAGLAASTAEEIVKHQPFADISDFYKRVNKSKVKFNNILAMAYAGVFDEIGDRRGIIKWLWDEKKPKGKKMPALTDEHMMLEFREAMGFFEQKVKKIRPGFSARCITETDLRLEPPGISVTVGGMIAEVRQFKTKAGDPMGFATLVDLDEQIDLTFFTKAWSVQRPKVGQIVEIQGTKSGYRGKENAIEVEKMIVF